MLTVHGVEMGRCMFSPKHLDDDAEKVADGRHDFVSRLDDGHASTVDRGQDVTVVGHYGSQQSRA